MKNLNELENWNLKQLRNLRINLNNRIQAFDNNPKPKDLQKSHALYEMGKEQCQSLLEKVKRLEKSLNKA